MMFNPYLNLRFVNSLHEVHFLPFSVPELYWATQANRSEALAYTERLLRQEKVTNGVSLRNYLTSMRDAGAWKIGVFKFFHSFNRARPGELANLSLNQDSAAMERFIDGLEIDGHLADYYRECGHDPHLALKYSVSKIICDEKRLTWMKTFCDRFASLLDLAADTGIIAGNLTRQIDITACACAIGIVGEAERDELLKICGGRIVTMFPSWGRFLAAYLLCCLYDVCLSSAEIRYLPRQAQDLIDSCYLCCNNRLNDVLTIPGWHDRDLPELKEALRPLANAAFLDERWGEASDYELNCIAKIDEGFRLFAEKLHPYIEAHGLGPFFRESGKFDQFIAVTNGGDFRIYLRTLHMPLAPREAPLMLAKFGLFTSAGFWSFERGPVPKFAPWPERLTVESGAPAARDYGTVTVPMHIRELDCDLRISLPRHYTCSGAFLLKTPQEQAEYVAADMAELRTFFARLPELLRS